MSINDIIKMTSRSVKNEKKRKFLKTPKTRMESGKVCSVVFRAPDIGARPRTISELIGDF